jgi:hypothetical protein
MKFSSFSFFFVKCQTIEIICFSYLVIVVVSLHLPCSVLSFSIVVCDFLKEGEREWYSFVDIFEAKKRNFYFIFHSSIYTSSSSMSLHKDTTFTSMNLKIILSKNKR